MEIPFYFDYACPWAYLGSCRVEAYFRDLGAVIDFRPVHLAALVEPTARKGAPPGDRKKRYYPADLMHWAEMIGAEFAKAGRRERPDTRLLLKGALVASDEGRFREYHYPAYRARWAEARDVADPELVGSLLGAAGLDAQAALARAQSDELESRLRADTQAAIERGVFGVPTLFVGDEMFWGNDRFELARYFIEKQREA
ncbi:MAG: DsbA family protein [Deltaproteobacteria bacterium]|nr:MAG: DsbA family protein [Deltaproteobacteria bacterium]